MWRRPGTVSDYRRFSGDPEIFVLKPGDFFGMRDFPRNRVLQPVFRIRKNTAPSPVPDAVGNETRRPIDQKWLLCQRA